jgi:DNA repair ATPase RecN
MPIKVRVQNFQSLEDVSLTIDGFTVVTGTNNAGKSALFRAIQGVFMNTPGTSFVRHGSNHSSVELQFDENHTVVWEKGNKVNRYVINGKVFDNVGAGTPLELTEFGVNPVTLQEQKYWPRLPLS